MTREEAKLFLHTRRFDRQDDDDPRMAEALELVGRDSELRAWHEEQRGFDASICDKLRQVRVPPGLAAQILAQKNAPPVRRTRRAVLALAMAASIALLLSIGLALVWQHQAPATEFAEMRTDMAKFLVKFPELDVATEQWPEMIRWLTRNPAVTGIDLPPRVQRFPGLGCREVKWRGKRLMLVCFVAQGEVVHLFVLPGREVGAPSNTPATAFMVEKGWNTASWSKGETIYLMMTRGSIDFLKDLLGGVGRI